MGGEKDLAVQIREPLTSWFLKNQRDLPWRQDYHPYQIWISEIMLQQTQVRTVIPFFNNWIKRFPDIDSLAGADEATVLKFWEGLGYYSRAKNILKTAILLKRSFDNRLPDNKDDLQKLPGIGPYTAGAIASIAFQRREPIIDGNIRRVFSRLFLWKELTTSIAANNFFNQKSEQLLSVGDPRIINQSFMELGALICTKNQPKCAGCPVSSSCLALKFAQVSVLPKKKKAPGTIKRELVYLILNFEEKFYLEQQKEGDLWASLWCFPFFDSSFDWESKYSLDEISRLEPFAHAVTKYRITAKPILIKLDGDPQQFNFEGDKKGRWVSSDDIPKLALTKAGAVICNQLGLL
ncbi:MAG: A/G-specific adenine glycosylase [Proteobacteria bacterium]|nr:A/G-specific adenine glycosylase [Pseudomonadota bacterium]